MWRERIDALTEGAAYAPPATGAAIRAAQALLDGPLPDDLVDLLAETDGVLGDNGLGVIWPVERIVRDNLMFRSNPDFASLYMPFDALLFFGDGGNGDQFAFPCSPRRDEVFMWDHETDSRTWVAGSLDQYLERLLGGTLRT